MIKYICTILKRRDGSILKKLCSFILFLLMIMLIFSIQTNAATEFEFELNYTGDIVLNETKEATVVLKGTNATTYTNVRVKIEVDGPGTPKITAVDSLQQEIDIVEEGYWGPPGGFPVSGTFENETPIKATFSVPGTYTVKLSLVNMQASEAELASRTFTIEVLEDATNVNEITEPEVNETENNTIDKLPQTGTSIVEYIIYLAVVVALIIFIYKKMHMTKV